MSSPAQTASDLVRRIVDGDRQAEAELVETYSRGVTYLLLRVTGDHALSEDLHQETFRIVLQKVRNGDLRQPEKLSAFLRSTARNLAIAEYRRPARRYQADDPEDLPEPVDPAPSQLSQVLDQEDRSLVRQVLAELRSERDRQVLYRYHIAEDDKERICQDLELTSRQFNLVLFRAHRRFKKLLESSAKRQALKQVKAKLGRNREAATDTK